mmetsp:Transcript_16418/g.49421  ORF Transcript_16418/g.49421 Transcript_16418/m.49421 type:complete len:229 (-) Transcript_16418:56-742(-)
MGWGADKPFLTRIAIRRWKAKFPNWPPPDASPVTPVEPWGKQFFVYNAPDRVELRGDIRAPPLDAVRPAWVRDEDAASMLVEGEDLSALPQSPALTRRTIAATRSSGSSVEPAETVLCVTDFRQRPMLFLRPEEWAEVLQQLPRMREEMKRCKEAIDDADEVGSAERDYALRRTYVHDKHSEKRIGRMGYGSSHRRSYETGKVGPRARAKKVPLTTHEMERLRRGDEE